MKNMHLSTLFACFILGYPILASGQSKPSAHSSLDVVNFDYLTKRSDKPVPFDKSFTLVVDKVSSKNIKAIEVFQIEFIDGVRSLTDDISLPTGGKMSLPDLLLRPESNTDTLTIVFPALRPSINFDVAVVRTLTGENRQTAYQLNEHLFKTESTEAGEAFKKLRNGAKDQSVAELRTYFTYTTLAEYNGFYVNNLSAIYGKASNPLTYSTSSSIDLVDLQAIEEAFAKKKIAYEHGGFLRSIVDTKYFPEILLGKRKPNASPIAENTSNSDLIERQSNLKQTAIFFDSLINSVYKVLSSEDPTVIAQIPPYKLSDVNKKLLAIQREIDQNADILEESIGAIDKEIDENTHLLEVIWLSGTTSPSDLKTTGASIFVLDAGITNIFIPNLENKIAFIPKLYLGVNIYFRPIDKNTRRGTFPKKYKEENDQIGPDYNIASKFDILQHLSLNLGFTLGEMQDPEFDNFYNGTSLLIGPAYRFKRAYKVSAGLALLNRQSKDPLESGMKVGAGTFLSLSVDLDLIQTLKDITSILFK